MLKEKKLILKINYCLTIEDIAALGIYREVNNYPEGMLKEFGKSCNKESCRYKKAASKVYKIFVQRGEKWHARYPGDMIKGMAWYELLYLSKLKDTQKSINLYLKYGHDNYPNNLKLFRSKHEKKIFNLINMNKGRIKMRNAMGMSIENKIENVIDKHWTLGEFLNNDELKVKKVTIDPKIIKREKLLKKYQATLKRYKAKLEEEKNKKIQ